MNNIERLNNFDDDEFIYIVSTCHTKVEVHKILNIPYNGTGARAINKKFNDTGAKLKPRTLKWKVIEKICPVCGNIFKDKMGHPKEKETCSHGCANTYFRSGRSNPNWKEECYQTTCWLYHGKKCVVCGESLIVEVHHYDSNHDNVNPDNLIPLCPTHHKYWHSKHRYLIRDKIEGFRKNISRSTVVVTD